MIDVPKHVAGKQCPLCLVQNTCLGPFCLGLSGKYIIPAQHKYEVYISGKTSAPGSQTREDASESGIPGLLFVDNPDVPAKWYGFIILFSHLQYLCIGVIRWIKNQTLHSNDISTGQHAKIPKVLSRLRVCWKRYQYWLNHLEMWCV